MKLNDSMKVAAWALEYQVHIKLCQEFFETRADVIVSESKKISNVTTLGPIQAIDICMQIEAEFPKRLEEVLERADQHPNGILIGLVQFITYLRTTGG